jgi:Zn-dependent M28 family amino/carboxypeptidase
MLKKFLNFFTLALLFFAGSAVFHACQIKHPTDFLTFSDDYYHYVTTLSSDEFEGRAPLTAGGHRTKDFIEGEFRRMGLKPAANGSYRQAVPLVEIVGSNFSELVIEHEDGSLSFDYLYEMMVGTTQLKDHVSIEESELVFAGYGIVAPEYDWNDYEGLDVEGKTVIVLVNDPGYELQDPELFTGNAMTYYGRWTYKYEEAARQGAAGVLIVHETGPAGYGWDVVRNSWSGPQYEVGGDNGLPAVEVQGWLTRESANKVFERAGYTLDDLRQMALQRDFQAFSLGMTASASFDIDYTISESYNIAGYVEGSQYPDETIIYMAHWDHLGKKETPEGIKIYNGAIDNATGTAAIMVIAEKFATMDPPPQRSVVFLAVTAEESGLIGSNFYSQNPLFPLETTVGGINIDGMNVYGPTHDISVIGYNASQMQDFLGRFARDQNRVLLPERNPERGYFYRSDHFNLVREGVPMLYATRGHDYVDRDEEYTRWVEEDLDRRYHSTDDVVTEHWDWSGIDQDLWLYFYVGESLANSRDWPQWSEGSEFRAVRQESDHLRN